MRRLDRYRWADLAIWLGGQVAASVAGGGVMKRLYVAGPMTGIKDANYPAFNAAATKLRALGFEVENPAENPEPSCGSWLAYMRMAVVQVSKVDGLILLPGWEKSKGARVEFNLAVGLGLSVMTLDEALAQFAEAA
jgi:hypothetical protein